MYLYILWYWCVRDGGLTLPVANAPENDAEVAAATAKARPLSLTYIFKIRLGRRFLWETCKPNTASRSAPSPNQLSISQFLPVYVHLRSIITSLPSSSKWSSYKNNKNNSHFWAICPAKNLFSIAIHKKAKWFQKGQLHFREHHLQFWLFNVISECFNWISERVNYILGSIICNWD